MNREILKESQPHALTILENSFSNHRLSHAYIFYGPKGSYKKEMALHFAMMLYGGIEPDYNSQASVQILNNNHLNVIQINPKGNNVRKEQIIALQDEFSKTSQVEGPRIYIIEDADTMTTSAMNSLLKFIEEPTSEDTYGILITQHLDSIIPTIRSRSVAVGFNNLSKKRLEEELLDEGIDNTHIDSLVYLANNKEDALALLDSEDYKMAFDGFNNFIKQLKDGSISLFVKANRDLFYSRDGSMYFANLIEGFYRDLLEFKMNEDLLYFKHDKEVVSKIASRFSMDKIVEDLELILKLEKRLPYYVNITLNFNQLFLAIGDENIL